MLRFVRNCFFIALAGLAIGFYLGDELPEPEQLLPQLTDDPLQRATDRLPFDTTVNKVTYHIKPLFRYELYGLVVSRHTSDSFIDYAHKEWNDHINVADLCVIWGHNAFSGIYRQMDFSSGQWVCYAGTKDEAVWRQFSGEHLSNNHLLADAPDILKTLRKVRVGDQVHMRGYLAEYSHAGGFFRGSSTVRTDTGNGACETVYLEAFDILKNGGHRWRYLRWFFGFLLVASVLAWFTLPQRFHVHQ